MKKSSRSISIFVIIAISLVLALPLSVSAAVGRADIPRILVIVNDISEFDETLVSEFAGQYDIVDAEGINYAALRAYAAFAVPIDVARADRKLCSILQAAYHRANALVYLYGELTISDFKQALKLEQFGAYVNIHDQTGITADQVFTSFGEEQENTAVENIISSSGDLSGNYLIADVAVDEFNSLTMASLAIILDDFCASAIQAMAVIVKSGYNFRSYYNADNYINMDYLLYKDNDETDPDYDYFAVKTNLCTENGYAYNTQSIDVKHALPFTSDEMIDYGPGDINYAGTVSVGLDLGGTFGLSYSFTVNGTPNFNATYSAASDYCTWEIYRPFLGGYLQNNIFSPGSSWASTGTYAGTNVDFKAHFVGGQGHTFDTPWKYVQIRYDY